MKYVSGIAAIIALTSNLVSSIDIQEEASPKQNVVFETLAYNYDEDRWLSPYGIHPFNLEREILEEHREQLEKQMELEWQEALKEQQALEQQRALEQQKMDFTNFIKAIKNQDTTNIDLRKPSGLTSELANEVLKGTGLDGLGEAFVNSEKKYQVNAYYLMAHAAWESEWGKSRLSQTKNNLFGFQAYDENPYGNARHFNSKEESIDIVANYVSEHYLKADGDHYNGPTLIGMNVKYASDIAWAEGIGSIMSKFVFKLSELKGV